MSTIKHSYETTDRFIITKLSIISGCLLFDLVHRNVVSMSSPFFLTFSKYNDEIVFQLTPNKFLRNYKVKIKV